MKYDSIILDIDGTLWNTTEIVAEAWNKAIEVSEYNVKTCTAEILKKEFGKPMDVIARDLWPSLTDSDQAKLLELCCKYEHEYLEKNENDITFPKVVNTIKELSSKIDFYIVSNCQCGYIELMMKKTGLTPYIKDFESFGATGKQKGDNIKLIVKRNNLKKPVYVGDTQGDCDACKASGVDFIFAEYGFGQVNSCTARISSFDQLSLIYR